MSDHRRVVHVIAHLYTGGAQQLLVTWAREAGRRGDPVTVVSLSAEEGEVGSQLRALGVEVLTLPRNSTGPRSVMSQFLHLRRLLARRRPAVVQTHLTRAHLVGLPAAKVAGVPAVATLHNTVVGADGNSPRALWTETLLLRRLADAVVACGAVVERSQRERLRPRSAVVVPNATEAVPAASPQARTATRKALLGSVDAPVLLAVGRLADGKGYDDLLHAVALVAARRPEVVLVVAGDGPDGPRLRLLAERLCIAEQVRFLGRRPDVTKIMGAADVYVSASHWEGLPLALLEAMSAGLPVVVTSVGDVTTVVDPGSGLLVPPHEPAALASGVIELLDDPARSRALGEGARRRAAAVAGVPQWYDRTRAVHAGASEVRRAAWLLGASVESTEVDPASR